MPLNFVSPLSRKWNAPADGPQATLATVPVRPHILRGVMRKQSKNASPVFDPRAPLKSGFASSDLFPQHFKSRNAIPPSSFLMPDQDFFDGTFGRPPSRGERPITDRGDSSRGTLEIPSKTSPAGQSPTEYTRRSRSPFTPLLPCQRPHLTSRGYGSAGLDFLPPRRLPLVREL
jgi:hypothetical protein